jgi:hypothetical protein
MANMALQYCISWALEFTQLIMNTMMLEYCNESTNILTTCQDKYYMLIDDTFLYPLSDLCNTDLIDHAGHFNKSIPPKIILVYILS